MLFKDLDVSVELLGPGDFDALNGVEIRAATTVKYPLVALIERSSTGWALSNWYTGISSGQSAVSLPCLNKLPIDIMRKRGTWLVNTGGERWTALTGFSCRGVDSLGKTEYRAVDCKDLHGFEPTIPAVR